MAAKTRAGGEARTPRIEIAPAPGGRPPAYHPRHCARVQELGALGYSRAQIAADIGVARQTLGDWEDAHPDFGAAMERARDLELAWWEHAGQQGMFLTGFSTTAWGLQVRNRFPEAYRDKKELDVTVTHEDALEQLA